MTCQATLTGTATLPGPVRAFVLLAVVWSTIPIATPVFAVDALVTAAAGQPYGVASLEIPLANPVVGNPLPPLQVTDPDGRVLYPMARDQRVKAPTRPSERPVPQPGRGRLLRRVGNLIRELTQEEQGDLQQTISRQVTFLFTGGGPLEVTLADANGVIGTYPVQPTVDPAARERLLSGWWTTFTEAANRQIQSADYPPRVETYLVGMLSGRLDLPLPAWYRTSDTESDQLVDTLKLVLGDPSVGDQVFQTAAAGTSTDLGAGTLPLPPPPVWAPPFRRPGLDGVAIEAMATRIPPECFYIRYGSFQNYLWFRDLTEEYGGDLTRMLTLRGYADDASGRLERQLNMKTTELSRMMGPTVIADQALIGHDLFLADGASMGVVLQAANSFLLRTSLVNDRTRRADADDEASLATVQVAGREVSLLSTPDNRIRSFLVEDNGFFLVTNSKTLAERFIQVGEGSPSLASTDAFRLARTMMPVERDDTIFAYFSPDMMQALLRPESMIELRRRMSAVADLTLVRLSRLAASSEGTPIDGIDDLKAAGFLPISFGERPDGSGVVAAGDRIFDSMRGARGTFLPIADAQVQFVTPEESNWYREIADEYSRRFAELDPIMIGLKRQPLGDDGLPLAADASTSNVRYERLQIHAEVSPFRPGKYGKWARELGPPTPVAIEFAPDDIVAVQAHVAAEQLGPPTHLFAAIKDTIPPNPEDFDGILKTYRALKSLPGYLGAWPQPGALDRLPLNLGRGQPVAPGMSRLIGGLYRYVGGGFSVLSFWPNVLDASLPHMAAIEVEDVAQIRGRVGNLAGSQLSSWVNAQLYQKAAETSLAGANFLGLLTRQLRVPADSAGDFAEQILGGPLQCSLGGDFVFDPTADRWVSTAWNGTGPAVESPLNYQSPVMGWFRGATAAVTQYDDRLIADGVIDIERQ
ncbi:MAG: hypothetical protein AAGA03_06550 [Planctomycetota bacterium]